MNLLLSDKKIPIIKLIIVLLAGIFAVLLTRVSFVPFVSLVSVAISVACFSYVVFYTGIYSLIPATLIFLAVLFFENPISAINAIAFLLPALTAGFAFRNKSKPISVIVSITVSYLLYCILAYVITVLITTGSFSFKDELQAISSSIDENAQQLMEAYSAIMGNSYSSTEYVSSILKVLAVGTYISSTVVESCFIYIATALTFKITGANSEVYNGSLFDVMPSRITSSVYVISLSFTLFIKAPSETIKYNSMLAQNLLLILTPVLIFSGIYYILTIKFKVEHSSPFVLILAFISSIFGAFPIFIFYLALSGVKYSFKYSNLQKNEEAKHDQK